jgi:hypothetical protein
VSDFASMTADAQHAAWRLEIERDLRDQLAEQKAIRYALALRRRIYRLRLVQARLKARVKRLLRR